MKILLIVIPFVLLCLIIAGVAVWYLKPSDTGEEVSTVDVEADIQAIKDIVADINVAVNEADIEKLMSFYADDAVEIPPNEPAVIGKEAIRSSLQQYFNEVTYHEDSVVKAVHVSGDLAVAHVAWSGVATPKAGGESRKGNGNLLIVFQKQPDGSWKRLYAIYSNESLVRPTQSE